MSTGTCASRDEPCAQPAHPVDDEGRRAGCRQTAEQTLGWGRAAGNPTWAQNAARSREGRRSNHLSKHCAPVTTTLAGCVMELHGLALLGVVQTNTRSGLRG
jgi:hypothetical protein